MKEKTKKDLDELFNDDLLKCEIVETKENCDSRFDIVHWADNTFSVCVTDKRNGKMEEHERKTYAEANEVFESYIA